MDRVAKVLVFVEGQAEQRVLFSIKRKENKAGNRKLEFLGGHIEAGENALDALVRELAEEEESGTLAAQAREIQPTPVEVTVAGARHFLFTLSISQTVYDSLIAGRDESFGFQLVSRNDLFADELQNRLTRRTGAILETLKTKGGL